MPDDDVASGDETDASDNTDETVDETADDGAAAGDTVDWKAMARKHERDAKKAREALAKAQRDAMSEHDKAIAEARDEGRTEATKAAAMRIAAAEAKAALTGVVPDPAQIVEDLNLAKFVTDDGEVDTEAIGSLKARFSAFKPATTATPTPGARSPAATPSQLSRADLKNMTPEQIVEAKAAGRLNDLIGAN